MEERNLFIEFLGMMQECYENTTGNTDKLSKQRLLEFYANSRQQDGSLESEMEVGPKPHQDQKS